MTQIGQDYMGIWPEHPIENPQEGQTVRYPTAGSDGLIARGTIAQFSGRNGTIVHFTDGAWCYVSEIGEDRD